MATTTRAARLALAATAVTLALALTGCSSGAADPPTDKAAKPAVEETPEVPVVPVDAPVGTAVPYDQVDALIEAGASVWELSDHTGVVVDPAAPLPEAVVADFREITGGGRAATGIGRALEVRNQLSESGFVAFLLYETQPIDGVTHYTVYPTSTIPGLKDFYASISGGAPRPTKEGAIEEVQSLIDAHPEAQFIDLTL